MPRTPQQARKLGRDHGAEAEAGTARVFKAAGWLDAERRKTRGMLDAGDITGVPGITVECKGGPTAETAGDGQIEKWLDEAELERTRENDALAVLVLKRAGIGEARAEQWWAVVRGRDLGVLLGLDHRHIHWTAPVRFRLGELVTLLAERGWRP